MPLPNGHPPARAALTPADIEEVNRVFSDAFTDRYHRDGMTGVRVPELNPAVWRYAIAAAGPGAMVWRDDTGIAAFNLAHANGVEGWMGPLAVRPDLQGRGLGRAIVTAGIDYLVATGCARVGLETMPRTVENIGFYSRLGFFPGHLTVSMVKDIHGAPPRAVIRLSQQPSVPVAIERAHRVVERLAPGLDFRREFELTLGSALGDVVAVGQEAWEALALWHATPLSTSRTTAELRILKLVAADRDGFGRVVEAALAEGARRGVSRVAIRCQTAYRSAYADLIRMGFRVQWTDLRMERAPATLPGDSDPVVLSNWEI